MIVQLPQGTTSLVLRLDSSGSGTDVVLQLASQAYGPTLASDPAPRRRTLLACAALGVVVGAVGLSFWNGPARSEAVLNMPHHAAWNDGGAPRQADAMPAELAEQLARPPSVIPPSGAPAASDMPARSTPGSMPAPPAGKNPFGLE